MRAAAATVSVDLSAVRDPRSGAPAFAYRGAVGPGPTLRVRPGDTLVVRLRNRLSRDPLVRNNVNLHFHGLSVSPRPPADDAMRVAAPGETLVYRVPIPRSQPPGLYWYHPHAHGETDWQVTSGMSGALIVEGAPSGMPEDLLVVREVQDQPDPRALPVFARPAAIRDAALLAMRRNGRSPMALDQDADQQPCSPKPGLTLTINGSPLAHLHARPGERHLVRLVNATAARFLDLTADGQALELVALDGFALSRFPGTGARALLAHLLVPPAGRAEFVVTGGRGRRLLRTRCFNGGDAADRNPSAVLAAIEPAAGSAENHAAPAAPSPRAGAAPPLPRPAARRTIGLTEDATGFAIDGRRFAMGDPPVVIARSGTIEEWTIENRTAEVHAFHVHQVHVAVAGENRWRDTVTVPPMRYPHAGAPVPGRVRLLVDLRDPAVRGDFLMHCHILDHEDGGMMALVRVR